ncbi:MAG: ABC transporter permease [Chloroflexota bacterium]
MGAVPLFGPSAAWLVVFYLVPLVLLLIQSFWTYDPVNRVTNHTLTLSRYGDIAADPVYRDALWRTAGLAALVTITDLVLAFPLATFVAYRAKRRTVALLLVLIPLCASYLVRVYAWRIMFGRAGVLNSFLIWTHVHSHPSDAFLYGTTAMYITFSNAWLPFMVLALYTALTRVPRSLIDAAHDLGATRPRTFVHVILPLVLPGIIVGSIATFSLTLGDYITPLLVGGRGGNLIGALIFSRFGETPNWPLGSALSVPVLAVVICFVVLARRAHALEVA